MEEQKVIVVTGGAGFVGSHLCEEFVKDPNNKVVSIDNYFTGSIDNHIDGIHYIEDEAKNIADYIDHADLVYHLGEYSRVEQSFEDIETVFDFNTQGLIKVLQFCKETGAKLVYSGSSTKYADQGEGPYQSPYAWTKSTNTDLVKAYAQWFDIDYAITYFYNVYGKREIATGKYATLIAKFTEKMKNNEPLTIVKPGTQQRNFTHIDDIVSGLIKVGYNGSGDGYGIGNPNAYSIQQIAEMFNPTVIDYLDPRPGNRMSADVVTDKTRQLGWEPKKSIETYINKLRKVNWNRSEVNY